jgi:hypothetical protein
LYLVLDDVGWDSGSSRRLFERHGVSMVVGVVLAMLLIFSLKFSRYDLAEGGGRELPSYPPTQLRFNIVSLFWL